MKLCRMMDEDSPLAMPLTVTSGWELFTYLIDEFLALMVQGRNEHANLETDATAIPLDDYLS